MKESLRILHLNRFLEISTKRQFFHFSENSKNSKARSRKSKKDENYVDSAVIDEILKEEIYEKKKGRLYKVKVCIHVVLNAIFAIYSCIHSFFSYQEYLLNFC